MQTNRELTGEVLKRAKALLARRQTRKQVMLLAGAGAVCLALIFAVALGMPGTISQMPRRRAVSDTLGALFLHNNALGYVVVGVLAFILGAAVTVMAFLSKKLGKAGNGDERA